MPTSNRLLKKYASPKVVWVQEEPENMGAWSFILSRVDMDMKVVARKMGTSPATGFAKVHKQEQAELVEKAFFL